MDYPVEGQYILITGAAQGVGLELALQLVARGASLALIDVNAEKLQLAKEACVAVARQEKRKCDVYTATVDVTDRSEMAIAAERLCTGARPSHFDTVVANAGIAPEWSIKDHDDTVLRRSLEVNFFGVLNTFWATRKYLRRGSYFMMMSSAAAVVPLPLIAAYALAKVMLLMLATIMRMEYKGEGIHIGVNFFSQLETEMTGGFDSPGGKAVRAKRRLLGFIVHRVVPLEPAAKRVVRGIERHARSVYAPARVRLLMLLPRPWLQAVMEALVGDVSDCVAVSLESRRLVVQSYDIQAPKV